MVCLLACSVAHGQGGAQGAPKAQPVAKERVAREPAAPAARGYTIGPRPAWVVAPPPAAQTPAGTDRAAQRALLLDLQVNHRLPRRQAFYREQVTSADASTLGSVSQHQIVFNPAYQTVTLHEVAVVRDGRRTNRLSDARIELVRREARLEMSVIDGVETLLIVLNDVRVGDVVELSYTIEGDNPIFEGRISALYQLGWDVPVDMVHVRLIAPQDRKLQVRPLATDIVPEQTVEGGSQVIRVVRTNAEPVALERQTPPWFKAYPAVQVTEYQSWSEVDRWAQRLFDVPRARGAEFESQVAGFRRSGLAGAALVSRVLGFVQDEVRYFSAALGESSHRPRPADQTLADRRGDCKDKVVLLGALLTELGFDARPVLVSAFRNRGLADYLPSHDQFDHAVVRLRLDGREYFLDATLTGQGVALDTRGYIDFGRALVVGQGSELVATPPPEAAANRVEFEQRWDFSSPGKGVFLTTLLRMHGLSAEQGRRSIAQGNQAAIAEALAGTYVRLMPGLKRSAAAVVDDDREANTLLLTQVFESPDAGAYANGALQVEFNALELLEALDGPTEARRRMPYWIARPQTVSSRITVLTPKPVELREPAVMEIADRHFVLLRRVEATPQALTFAYRIELRADEVLPPQVESYRGNVLRARQQLGARLQLPLVEREALLAEGERIEQAVRSAPGFREDQLAEIVMRNEMLRAVDRIVLQQIEGQGPLAARVLVSRAEASNLVGDFAAGLTDAEAALALDADSDRAAEARAVALVGAGRLDDAAVAFTALLDTNRRTVALKWLGSVELARGRYAEAERALRQAIASTGNEEREFALLWLFVAAEYQGGRGKQAIERYLGRVDPKKLPGALLHFYGGRLDRDAVLAVAAEPPHMERLNLAEACFFIGQKLAAEGQRDEALRWFRRAVDTGAVPYREVMFARQELLKAR